jgi:hypothetical protein
MNKSFSQLQFLQQQKISLHSCKTTLQLCAMCGAIDAPTWLSGFSAVHAMGTHKVCAHTCNNLFLLQPQGHRTKFSKMERTQSEGYAFDTSLRWLGRTLGVSKWFSAALYAFSVYCVSQKHPIKAAFMGFLILSLLEVSEATSEGSGSLRRGETLSNSSAGISNKCVEKTLSCCNSNEPKNLSTHGYTADNADSLLHDFITEQMLVPAQQFGSPGTQDGGLGTQSQQAGSPGEPQPDTSSSLARTGSFDSTSSRASRSKSRKAANPGADTEVSAHSSSSHA